jgi:glycosyltransferase involved in cell wall biosynthesis
MSATVQKIDDPRNVATAVADRASADAPFPVIFVVTQSGNRANGGVESITQVLENLRRVSPIVITQIETPATQRWRDAGCELHAWDFSKGGIQTRSALQTNVRMFRLVRASGCRVVHCNDISALWHTAFGARLAGAKVILNVRNIKPAAQRYGWRWHLARKLSRQLVLSREMQSEFGRRLGVDNGHRNEIEYIYSSVDSTAFSPIENSAREALRERLGINEGTFAIGCVAPFDPRKAQLEFIKEDGPLLKQLVPQAKIYFIGDFAPERNDYARRCLDAATELNLNESISFVGFTPEVIEWYRALDLVVVASRNEGLARCMIESLACGTPVVSFDVCSAREILEEHACGVVVPQGDYQKLVEAIAKLAEQDSLRGQLASSGVALSRQLFEPRRVVAQYEALYSSLNRS